MDRFITQGHLPAFKKLRDQSIVCISDADEKAPELEPWIQWVTLHTGLPYEDHRVFDLGDGVDLKAKRTWDVVADAGLRAWVCGSMNSAVNTDKPDNLYILPDPWSPGMDPHPSKMFMSFFHVVRSYVQEYTRDKPPITRADFARFGAFMVQNGLSAKTVTAAMQQLLGERFHPGSRWRRAAILDRLQWDIFRQFHRKIRPAFSTLFLNSTAHYQHYYWRNMDPEAFSLRDSSERQTEYQDAILFGYKCMDKIVAECMDFAPDATIVLATALSQQPLAKYDGLGGKQIFKVTDINRLAKLAGVSAPFDYAPVMAEQFHMIFKTQAEAKQALEALEALRTSEREQIMYVRLEGDRIFGGCQITATPSDTVTVVSGVSNETPNFSDLFYPVDGLKSGHHHPDGILWFRLPSSQHRVIERKIPIQEIAATLVELCGVDGSGLPTRAMLEILAQQDKLRSAA